MVASIRAQMAALPLLPMRQHRGPTTVPLIPPIHVQSLHSVPPQPIASICAQMAALPLQLRMRNRGPVNAPQSHPPTGPSQPPIPSPPALPLIPLLPAMVPIPPLPAPLQHPPQHMAPAIPRARCPIIEAQEPLHNLGPMTVNVLPVEPYTGW